MEEIKEFNENLRCICLTMGTQISRICPKWQENAQKQARKPLRVITEATHDVPQSVRSALIFKKLAYSTRKQGNTKLSKQQLPISAHLPKGCSRGRKCKTESAKCKKRSRYPCSLRHIRNTRYEIRNTLRAPFLGVVVERCCQILFAL